MSAEREFDVVFVTEQEGGYSVFVPELPSVAAQGETIEEARANAARGDRGISRRHARGWPSHPHRAPRPRSGPRRVSQTPAVTEKQLVNPSIHDAIPVPAHGNQPITKGTLGNILRTAGINPERSTGWLTAPATRYVA
jgi:hypothetical protein